MVTQVATTTSSETGVRVNLTGEDDVYIMPAILVASINDKVISSTTGFHTITVMGAIYGGTIGISISGSVIEQNHVFIGSDGSVVGGNTAISIQSNFSSIVNYGTISGTDGAEIFGNGVRVVNYGSITVSGFTALQVSNPNFGFRSPITDNYGSISSAFVAYFGSDSDETLRNFGTIDGDVYSQGGKDHIVNRGLIGGSEFGQIDLGENDDTLDNNGGEIGYTVDLSGGNDRYIGLTGTVTSTVSGGSDNDTMIGNPDADDTFDGGAGVDLLDFRRGPAVVLALNGSFAAAGAALGDTYTGFEAVRGSAFWADLLRGDGFANALSGLGGKDSLEGAGGADTLSGGNLADVLTGGNGSDTFRYDYLSDGGDMITDFSAGIGNDDQFQIVASAFGGGLVAGALAASQFQNRADNAAQDSDDRFIFRTTDRTLWFDVDGLGGAAAVMMADLQASATLTALDISLI